MSSILTVAKELNLEIVYFRVSSLEVLVLELETLLLGALLQNQVSVFSVIFLLNIEYLTFKTKNT
jgi:hypothetical protein